MMLMGWRVGASGCAVETQPACATEFLDFCAAEAAANNWFPQKQRYGVRAQSILDRLLAIEGEFTVDAAATRLQCRTTSVRNCLREHAEQFMRVNAIGSAPAIWRKR